VAVILAFSSTPAYCPFLIPIVASVLISVGVGAITAGILASVIVSVGLSLIATALRGGGGGGAKAAEQADFGIKSTLQTGGVVPRSFGFGTFCTAGSEVYPARTWGNSGKTPNAYFTRFIALSDLPMNSLTAIIVNDQRCTYGSGSPDANLGYKIPEFNNGTDHLWVKFYDGTQTTADSWAVSQFGSDPDYPYSSSQVGRGVAYVIVTALIDQNLFSSFPQFQFEGLGAKFYDPRSDSSVGGSGSQRWATPSTWAHTYNPAVIKYNVLRGISYYNTNSPPVGSWLFGLQGTDAARLPLDNWFAAMNVDDDSEETSPGVFAAQYRCGGEVSVNQAPVEFLDELNKCDSGRVAEAGGIFKTRSGAAGAAVMSFTDADLIITAQQTFDMFPGLEQTINGVSATYHDPAQNWAETDAPSLFDPDLEDEDGSRRLIAALQFNYVPYQSQVQRLMKNARDEARNFRKHVVIASPIAAQLEPLDVIAWTSTINGYTSKLFSVIPTDQNDLDQVMVLQEVDPADYDWDSGIDYTTYTPVAVISRSPATQAMSGWAVSGLSVNGAGGRSRAVIKLQWDVAGIDDVDAVQYEVRLPSDSPPSFVVAGETERFLDGYIYISENILSATTYEARGRYLPAGRNRPTSWSSWLSVTTPNAQLVGNDIADAILTYAKFAASIQPVQVVTSLAAADISSGKAVAYLTTDGQLYRYFSGAWTVAVPAVNVGNGLTGSQIAALTITGSNLVAATITGSKIASATIGAGNIIASTITANEIAANTITAAKIAAATITANEIAAATITAAKIAAGTITANEIAANTITAAEIAANAITSSELTANSVVAGKIAAGAINVDTILASNVVVTGHLVANAITETSGAANSGGTSLGVTVNSATYAVVIWAYLSESTPFGDCDVTRDGSSILYGGGGLPGGTFILIDTPSAGGHTYAVNSSSPYISALVVTQLKR
jgi:hypothetical protein